MTASHALQTLRRPPVLIVLALAAAFGTGAWLLAEELTSEVRPVSTASVEVAPPAIEAARQAIDTAIDVALPTAAAAGTAADGTPVDIAPVDIAPAAPSANGAPTAVEDPHASAIIEPVDPAEVLFGDHAAVAVSND